MADVRRQSGFTLVEIMAAVLILTFGVTSLLGLMTLGVSTRRSAEQINRAVFLVDEALFDIHERAFSARPDPDAEDPADVERFLEPPPPIQVDAVDGMPGMSYRVEFTVDPEDPDVVLARIDVRWREQGEAMAETFHRLLVRHEPFPKRVARIARKS